MSSTKRQILIALSALACLAVVDCKAFEQNSDGISTLKIVSFEECIHPILEIKSGEHLPERKLPVLQFSELNDFRGPNWIQNTKQAFLGEETQAAQWLCARSVGRDTESVKMLAGIPQFEGVVNSNSNLGNNLLIGDSLWFYNFGLNRIQARFVFREGRCILATRVAWDTMLSKVAKLIDHQQAKSSYHPILHIRSGQKVDKKWLNNAAFLKLNRYSPPNTQGMWRDYFWFEEVKAAVKFSVVARGKTKSEIVRLGGPPDFQGKGVSVWKFANQRQELWLYSFGGSNIPVRLAFDGATCLKGEIYPLTEHELYAKWRIKKITTSAVGSTLSAIIKEHGHPASFVFAPASRTDIKTITYKPGNNSPSVTLSFINGRCHKTFVDDGLIAR